ncbi:MAG: hypothetical protein MK137_03195, partial [Rickettsiales bacterium]|nr:hypothetical protein [Rickettsiales bacterium]
QAEEKVVTSRQTEVAERNKQIELIEATKQAEKSAISIKISAEAEKQAADDKAEALRIEAQAASDKLRIVAEGEANAEKLKANAAEIKYKVEAEGQNALNNAANILSSEQIDMKVKMELIHNLDRIIRESVKPIENIDGIKIVQFDGMNGNNGSLDIKGGSNDNVSVSSPGGNGSLADQIVNSALKYRTQAPLLDSLLKEIGIDGSDINSLKDVVPFGDSGAPSIDGKPEQV